LSFRPKGEILINTLRYKIPHYVRNDTERYFARGSCVYVKTIRFSADSGNELMRSFCHTKLAGSYKSKAGSVFDPAFDLS